MAIRLFAVMAVFAIAVLWPINRANRRSPAVFNNGTGNASGDPEFLAFRPTQLPLGLDTGDEFELLKGHPHLPEDMSAERTYLWAYVVFTYLFVALTLYSINWETFRIIRYRQDYLGTQSTVTDRTFRLTGIPIDMRSPARVQHLIEKLDIGKVDTVTLCRDWEELDLLVEMRNVLLRKLEVAWATLLNTRRARAKDGVDRSTSQSDEAHDDHQRGNEDGRENERLLESNPEQEHTTEGDRPQVTIRFGFLGFRKRELDAIDYYEEKLRRLDTKITEARKKTFKPTDMALVTMDSVASCQMVIQARIDPHPGRLLTKVTPAPSDLVWKNTYALRGIRRLKSWSITIFITLLTLLFIFPTAFLASLLSICTMAKVSPGFATWLTHHSVIESLLQNGVPTLVVSLLNVAVPYLYDWLSNCQGMISQGDVELSVISKNFFFTFFNTFFVFAVSKTGLDFWSVMKELLKDTSQIPAVIFAKVEEMSIFYICFILLQGIGLMPFRILEVGSVFLYPFYRFTAKTPRDFAELEKPPVFQYGFYLPTALLVFNLCLIYSVLIWGYGILIAGTLYFLLGYYGFKYMVLYAMDQPQHATGGAWRIICYRIVFGLLVFEIVMFGQVASLRAFLQSICLLPLIPVTIWYSYYFKRRFEPLTRYIALRAIRSDEDTEDAQEMDEEFENERGPRPSQGLLRRGSTIDEYKEKGLVFVNPSLVLP